MRRIYISNTITDDVINRATQLNCNEIAKSVPNKMVGLIESLPAIVVESSGVIQGIFQEPTTLEKINSITDDHPSKIDTLLAPIGAMIWFSGQNIPSGWLRCEGQEISRIDFAALFAVIGTKFGCGSDGLTFNLPKMDLQYLVKSKIASEETLCDTVNQTLDMGCFIIKV